uniref:Phosphatidylinositol 5-phosphate 4-kinase type-2 gamma n=1 Tax=Sinocyclocheilus anshuiensis TaxID=1608454 RepID=A0A671Q0F0_9TELE
DTGAVSSTKKHFVHQKVEVFWASDPNLTVFMWGINHTFFSSINDLFQVPMPVMLLPDDFKSQHKNESQQPFIQQFKEYCPLVFRNLRERFGVEHQDYLVSLTHSPPAKDGKSQEAGLVLTSYDRTLIVKQISSEEVEDMHNILLITLKGLHIVTCHGSTLLPQFPGLYRVTVDNEDTYLLVMINMFCHRLTVHSKYDLKGSFVSREASDKEKVKELPTFKDVDFRNNMQRVYISEEEKEKLLDKLNWDIEFLVRLKVMYYSLLLGIHDVWRAEQEEAEEIKDSLSEEEEDSENDLSLMLLEFDPYVDVYAIQSAVGCPHREVYFMGLINILSQYDTKKKTAHAAKTVKHGAGAEISTVHPEQNAKRFREFIANIFA